MLGKVNMNLGWNTDGWYVLLLLKIKLDFLLRKTGESLNFKIEV
jgi:hypothetical protein